jgi:hypothetical protein
LKHLSSRIEETPLQAGEFLLVLSYPRKVGSIELIGSSAVKFHTTNKEQIMITEIIEFKLKEDTDEENFMSEAKKYHAYFKATFKGFIDLEFTKGEYGWINIMHWENMEYVKACGEVLRTGPQEIAGYAALTDRASLKLTFLDQKLYLK